MKTKRQRQEEAAKRQELRDQRSDKEQRELLFGRLWRVGGEARREWKRLYDRNAPAKLPATERGA